MSLLIKVGSFTKPITAAPFSQAITGVGFQPKAVFLYGTNPTGEVTWTTGSFGGSHAVWSSTSAADEYALGDIATHNVAAAAEGESVAQKAFRIHAGTNTGEASLTSIDADGFTLNWTSNQNVARVIHYVAIAGSDVLARAHSWALPTSTGLAAVTGVGFRPDLVLFILGNEATTAFQATGTSTTGGRTRLGAMDRDGHQWALAVAAEHAANPSDTERSLLSDSCIQGTSANTLRLKAKFASMDADGYTVNFTTAPATAGLIGALAIGGGILARVGVTAKPTGGAPASHTVAGIGFRPKGIILAGVQNTSSAAIATHAEIGVGAASSTADRAACCRINRDNITPTNAQRYCDSTKVFVKADNATPAVDAAADLVSFDQDGFTLTWNPNDGVATEVAYIALGDQVRPRPGRPAIRSRGANLGRKQRGAWRRRTA